MRVFIPILPALLLALYCAIAGFWSLRAIDRFLAENSTPVGPNPSGNTTDANLRSHP